MNLQGKVVVITGSASGLGLALAHSATAAGGIVVVSGNDKDAVANAAVNMNAYGIAADVTDEAQLEALKRECIDKFGGIDVWINNAGTWIPHGPIEAIDMARLQQMMEVNLYGTINGVKVALRLMREQGSGIIVNILSTDVLTGKAGSAAYCATKSAAAGFTKSLQLEVQGSGIAALAVYPGAMQTDLFDEKKPENFDSYMDPAKVAEAIINNLKEDQPNPELIIQ